MWASPSSHSPFLMTLRESFWGISLLLPNYQKNIAISIQTCICLQPRMHKYMHLYIQSMHTDMMKLCSMQLITALLFETRTAEGFLLLLLLFLTLLLQTGAIWGRGRMTRGSFIKLGRCCHLARCLCPGTPTPASMGKRLAHPRSLSPAGPQHEITRMLPLLVWVRLRRGRGVYPCVCLSQGPRGAQEYCSSLKAGRLSLKLSCPTWCIASSPSGELQYRLQSVGKQFLGWFRKPAT